MKNWIKLSFLVFRVIFLSDVSVCDDDLFPVSIIHINDFHDRFEETSVLSAKCTPQKGQCIAGIARLYTTIKHLKDRRKNTNPVYLNAGDNFQGSLWYNLLRWNVTQYFLNLLPADAMTIGNHEFDHGIEGLIPFLERCKTPITVCNIDISKEPSLKGAWKDFLIIKRSGVKIGLIGVIYDKTDKISRTRNLAFLSSIESVKKVGRTLKDQGVNIVIVISHCGLDEDKLIAKTAGENIDVIVGGHSHSYLYSGDNPGPNVIEGSYPVVVKQTNGHRVLILQAAAFGKYVGDLTVYFDKKGEVRKWEGSPVYQNNSVRMDPEILKELIPWRLAVEEMGSERIGATRIFLNKENCRSGECGIGNLVADAFVDEYTIEQNMPIAMIHAGNFRNSLRIGDVTYGDLLQTIPFSSYVDNVEIMGTAIKDAVEHAVTYDNENRFNILQVSGLRIFLNISKPVGTRVVSIDVRNSLNPELYEPLALAKIYSVILPSYLADGGDGFYMLKNIKNRINGALDIDILVKYVKKITPLTNSKIIQGRTFFQL